MVTFSLSLPPSNREPGDVVRAADHNETVTAVSDLAQQAGDNLTALHGELAQLVTSDDPRLSNPRPPTSHTHPVTDLNTYGQADGTTFLRGDGMWAQPSGTSGTTVEESATEPSPGVAWVDPDAQDTNGLADIRSIQLHDGSTWFSVGDRRVADILDRLDLLSSDDLNVGGSASSSTFLRGDNTWASLEAAPVLNLAERATLDGATDNTAALAAAVAEMEAGAAGDILIPNGSTLYLNSPVYLTSTDADLTYRIRGEGRGSRIVLGPGLNGKYAIHVNENAAGTQVIGVGPARSRLIVENVQVRGADDATDPSWVRTNGGGVTHRHVKFSRVHNGLRTLGYTDLITWDHIEWRDPVNDGWMWNSGFNGDGVYLNQVFATAGANVARLSSARGGTIINSIGGCYEFQRCQNIDVIAAHIEDTDSDATPYFRVISSIVTFRDCHLWGSTDGAPSITIDDDTSGSLSRPYSRVTIEDTSFTHVIQRGDRAPDVHLANVHSNTTVRFSRAVGLLATQSGWVAEYIGLLVTANDATVQAAIDADPARLLGESELRQEGVRGWVLAGPAGDPVEVRMIGTPILTAQAVPHYPGTHPEGVFYYRAQPRTPWGNGLASGEASATTAGSARAVTLTVRPDLYPTVIGVYRGTSPDSYTHYAEVVVGGRNVALADTGSYLCGVPWTTSVPPVEDRVNTSVAGVVAGGQSVTWGSAPPDTGTWERGDVRFNRSHTTTVGWRCVSGGTPGTWIAFGVEVAAQ